MDDSFFALRHQHSVDQISGTVLKRLRVIRPDLFSGKNEKGEVVPGKYKERWWSGRYGAEIEVVRPVARIDGVETSWVRAARPNGSDNDNKSWAAFEEDSGMEEGGDYRL
jgi:hypothetical protein